MNVLLFFSEHEPVEEYNNEVANNGQSIKQMMSSLKMHCGIRCLQGVFAKVNSVTARRDACNKRYSCQHEGPVSEWNKEAIQVHIQKVCDVTHQG